MHPSRYEQQIRWRQETQEQARQARKMEEEKLKEECTFHPTYYTQLHSVPEFEGSAKTLTKISGDNHVRRQEKARMNRKYTEERGQWQPSKKTKVHAHSGTSGTGPLDRSAGDGHLRQASAASVDSMANNVHSRQGSNSPTHSPGGVPPELPAEFLRKSQMSHAGSVNEDFEESFMPTGFSDHQQNMEEFTLVRQLEQERKEWSEERCKLMHCLHLQQLELTQRASAAQQRAGEIAKEFARAIEEFETRLLSVETNVQKEILVIKNITENLRHDIITAIKENNSNNSSAPGSKSPDEKSVRE